MKHCLPLLLFGLLMFGCESSDFPGPPDVGLDDVVIIEAFPGLSFSSPVFLTHAGDGSNRVFVVERGGVIRVFENDTLTTDAATFLNISDRVVSGGETGLLGLAFHPDFAGNGFFFVNYTTNEGPGGLKTRVSRFSANDNDGQEASEVVLLEVDQPFSNHNGGMLAFGNDGFLYIALGDGGSGGDPFNNAQDRTVLLGSILRIDVDRQEDGLNYAIPASNPFVGAGNGVREEIFAYGLRNPWRFSIDAPSGQIWAGDVGQGAREEIDLIESGGNYGWRVMEGSQCFNASNCDRDGLILPVAEYDHGPECSVTGGYVYRGSDVSVLAGLYVYGDFCSGVIWVLRYDNGQVTQNEEIADTGFSISSFGIDEQGELYILDLGGRIFRFAVAG